MIDCMSKLDTRVAENLKRIMAECGYKSYRKLSLDAKLNETFVRDVIVGRSESPKLSSLEKVCTLLDRDISELLSPVPRQANAINHSTVQKSILQKSTQKALELKAAAEANGGIYTDRGFAILVSNIYEKLSRNEPINDAEIIKLVKNED